MFKVYNGTNHDLNLYTNTSDYAPDRTGKHFLRNAGTSNIQVYPKEIPLNVRVTENDAVSCCNLFYPDSRKAFLDTRQDYNKYDMIVVSSRYASYAISNFAGYPDYLDRLYTPVKLYNKETGKVVGCVGFKKVSGNFQPAYYTDLIAKHFTPSLASVIECVNAWNTNQIDMINYHACCKLTEYVTNIVNNIISNMTAR